MTEEEWFTTALPERMLEFLKTSDRKLRLFSCAAAMRLDTAEWADTVFKVAEAAAEGRADLEELNLAHSSVRGAAARSADQMASRDFRCVEAVCHREA